MAFSPTSVAAPPTLSRELLHKTTASVPLTLPDASVFELPEKILQFGTGVLLRGLCDYFVDEANRQGLFNGRIVVVKSTDRGDASAFEAQDNLFTLCVKGLQDGQPVEEYRVNAAISRTLSARRQWDAILAVARSSDLQLVISNTTEVGIQLVDGEDIRAATPASFPGKLVAVLYERWRHFGGTPESGLVIVPTELIPNNGTALQEICLELAHRNGLEPEFIDWLESANAFCNSLVDRIVPGKPNAEDLADLEAQLGYRDELLCVAEVYRLWAIETAVDAERVKKALNFAAADPAVIVAPDIEIYRELKLRLLNGTHTLTCGLNFLSGKNAVRESMAAPDNAAFVEGLMLGELAEAIPYDVSPEQAETFGRQVLDRFRNPFIEHKLLSITTQYTAKMRMRNVPLLQTYYQRFGQVPERFALGFAGYLHFMKALRQEDGQYVGERDGEAYPIQDDQAAWFYDLYQQTDDPATVVQRTLANTEFWGTDLNALPGFGEAVGRCLTSLREQGAAAVLATILQPAS
jgi:tagaturonate reductase